MVRILPALTLLFAIAIGGAQAARAYCQCLYQDGSHCCIADNNSGGCTNVCMNARALFVDHPCNAGGKNSKVSAWNAQFRTACANA